MQDLSFRSKITNHNKKKVVKAFLDHITVPDHSGTNQNFHFKIKIKNSILIKLLYNSSNCNKLALY